MMGTVERAAATLRCLLEQRSFLPFCRAHSRPRVESRVRRKIPLDRKCCSHLPGTRITTKPFVSIALDQSSAGFRPQRGIPRITSWSPQTIHGTRSVPVRRSTNRTASSYRRSTGGVLEPTPAQRRDGAQWKIPGGPFNHPRKAHPSDEVSRPTLLQP